MPPAYLRAPSVIKAAAEAYVPGCSDRDRKTKRMAMATQRQLDLPAARCLNCGHWHNYNRPRETR